MFTDRAEGTCPNPALNVLVPGGFTTGGIHNEMVPSEADWQPCVAGVTLSCTSVTPPFVRPLPSCPESLALTTLSGRAAMVTPKCTGGGLLRNELVAPPAHGSVAVAAVRGLAYTPAPGFSGEDTFTYRAIDHLGAASATARVVVTVNPTPPKPAAPKLAVNGTPRLDRRGRTLVQGTCDRACSVTLRLRLKLHTGTHGHRPGA